jgi:hypothetical protein
LQPPVQKTLERAETFAKLLALFYTPSPGRIASGNVKILIALGRFISWAVSTEKPSENWAKIYGQKTDLALRLLYYLPKDTLGKRFRTSNRLDRFKQGVLKPWRLPIL